MTHMPSTTINRRRFVCLGTQAALVAGAAGMFPQAALTAEQLGSSALAAKPDFPIVDTHQHLWDMSKVRQSWLTPGGPLTRNFVMKDYLEAAAGLGIVRTVYMEVDVDVDSQLAEAEYVLDICRRGGSPTVAAVIGGCPGEDSFKAYITRFKGSPFIKGVRQIRGRPPADKVRIGRSTLLRASGCWVNWGCVLIFARRRRDCRTPSNWSTICSGTQFILDHCGNADPKWYRCPGKDETTDAVAARRRAAEQWRRDIATLAKRNNVVCKISGIVAQARKTLGRPTIWPPSSTTV